ncbi:MAG: hypothetical protein LC778_08245 [Acidobacteria bacterium]|nr:hypothetical protein [Acidobacteriota bacterium]
MVKIRPNKQNGQSAEAIKSIKEMFINTLPFSLGSRLDKRDVFLLLIEKICSKNGRIKENLK